VANVNSAIFASAVSTSGGLSLTYRVGIRQGARHVRFQHQVSGRGFGRSCNSSSAAVGDLRQDLLLRGLRRHPWLPGVSRFAAPLFAVSLSAARSTASIRCCSAVLRQLDCGAFAGPRDLMGSAAPRQSDQRKRLKPCTLSRLAHPTVPLD
jgi:hypothetical protein